MHVADLPGAVAAVHPATLAPVVRAVLNAPRADPISWRAERISRGAPRATGIIVAHDPWPPLVW